MIRAQNITSHRTRLRFVLSRFSSGRKWRPLETVKEVRAIFPDEPENMVRDSIHALWVSGELSSQGGKYYVERLKSDKLTRKVTVVVALFAIFISLYVQSPPPLPAAVPATVTVARPPKGASMTAAALATSVVVTTNVVVPPVTNQTLTLGEPMGAFSPGMNLLGEVMRTLLGTSALGPTFQNHLTVMLSIRPR